MYDMILFAVVETFVMAATVDKELLYNTRTVCRLHNCNITRKSIIWESYYRRKRILLVLMLGM